LITVRLDLKAVTLKHSGITIVREYVFDIFQNPKNVTFTFFEVLCQKSQKM